MLELLTGFVLGLSLAAPPGPVTALAVDATFRKGAPAGMMVFLGATTADLTFFLVAWAGAVAVLSAHPGALAAATLAGAGVMLFYAWGAWRSAGATGDVDRVAPATFVTGLVVALTSPFNLAWWVSSGTVLMASLGILLFVGMFAGILSWVVFFPSVLHRLGRRSRTFQKVVAVASAAVLAGFGAWLLWDGVRRLTASF
ncbi:MAG TPA: LysE family transporter [Candidatus Thermoplasmatota archaeon]|nr:LysE family transporter [Candidatus Thermoplasmatota archaeon]